MIFYRNLREITFRLTNVIPERIIFVSRGITVHAFCSLIADNKTRFSCHMKHILYVQTGTPCLLWRVCLKWNSYKMFLLLVHVLWISTLLLCSYARTCFRNSDYELTGSCFLWTYRLLLLMNLQALASYEPTGSCFLWTYRLLLLMNLQALASYELTGSCFLWTYRLLLLMNLQALASVWAECEEWWNQRPASFKVCQKWKWQGVTNKRTDRTSCEIAFLYRDIGSRQ